MKQHGRFLFTSESVTEGHPDKMCDQISDAILDEVLRLDARWRVACETMAMTGLVIVGGEITTTAQVNYAKVARETVRDIGYTSAEYGFDADTWWQNEEGVVTYTTEYMKLLQAMLP